MRKSDDDAHLLIGRLEGNIYRRHNKSESYITIPPALVISDSDGAVWSLGTEFVQRGHGTGSGVQAGRQRRELSRGGQRDAARNLFPAAEERREHRVRTSRAGVQCADVVDHAQARVRDLGDAGGLKRGAHDAAAVPGVRGHVAGEVHLASADLAGHVGQHVLRPPVPHDKPGAALGECVVQIAQAFEEELGARAGGVAAVQQPVVEAEDRDDLVVRGECGGQRGMVPQAQIAAEPDHGGHSGEYPFRARNGEVAASSSPAVLRRAASFLDSVADRARLGRLCCGLDSFASCTDYALILRR